MGQIALFCGVVPPGVGLLFGPGELENPARKALALLSMAFATRPGQRGLRFDWFEQAHT